MKNSHGQKEILVNSVIEEEEIAEMKGYSVGQGQGQVSVRLVLGQGQDRVRLGLGQGQVRVRLGLGQNQVRVRLGLGQGLGMHGRGTQLWGGVIEGWFWPMGSNPTFDPTQCLNYSIYMCMFIYPNPPRLFPSSQCYRRNSRDEGLGQVRLGWVRLGQARLGQVRLGQVSLDQVRLSQCQVRDAWQRSTLSVVFMYSKVQFQSQCREK